MDDFGNGSTPLVIGVGTALPPFVTEGDYLYSVMLATAGKFHLVN